MALLAGHGNRLTLAEALSGAGTARLRLTNGAEQSSLTGAGGITVFTLRSSGTCYASAASTDAVGGHALTLSDDYPITTAGLLRIVGGLGDESRTGGGDDSIMGLAGKDTLIGLGRVVHFGPGDYVTGLTAADFLFA